MTALHVEQRPFPGHVPAPPPDPVKAAAQALANARRTLTESVPHPYGCRCSAWCRDDWIFAEHGAPALGHCVACNEPARSIDPDGDVRHPTCEAAA